MSDKLFKNFVKGATNEVVQTQHDDHKDSDYVIEVVPKGKLPKIPVLMQTEY